MLFATFFLSLVCRRGRGRPAQQISEEVQQRWSLLNEGPCPTTGTASRTHAYWQLSCGRCVGYKQVATCSRAPDRAFHCSVHSDTGRQPSQLVMDARLLLCTHVRGMGPIVVEAHLLHGVQKPFDMWLPQHKIAVEVDGKQHFIGSMYDKAAVEQYQYDRWVDSVCQEQRLRLVRLHYQDKSSWVAAVKGAIAAAAADPFSSFVRYTPSYTHAENMYSAAIQLTM